ncbi:hypothetical protein ENBRE01_1998 [Enteropsectra breve]|nr:hypothetical protein ENBRE01_1998 [Enteropsectra breve]
MTYLRGCFNISAYLAEYHGPQMALDQIHYENLRSERLSSLLIHCIFYHTSLSMLFCYFLKYKELMSIKIVFTEACHKISFPLVDFIYLSIGVIKASYYTYLFSFFLISYKIVGYFLLYTLYGAGINAMFYVVYSSLLLQVFYIAYVLATKYRHELHKVFNTYGANVELYSRWINII